jgi:predicted nucleic acid-binding protein
MAEIVNLNKARKARAKAEAARDAAANRTKHGRSKAERARDAAEAAKRQATLDGAKKDGA